MKKNHSIVENYIKPLRPYRHSVGMELVWNLDAQFLVFRVILRSVSKSQLCLPPIAFDGIFCEHGPVVPSAGVKIYGFDLLHVPSILRVPGIDVLDLDGEIHDRILRPEKPPIPGAEIRDYGSRVTRRIGYHYRLKVNHGNGGPSFTIEIDFIGVDFAKPELLYPDSMLAVRGLRFQGLQLPKGRHRLLHP